MPTDPQTTDPHPLICMMMADILRDKARTLPNREALLREAEKWEAVYAK